MTLLDAGIASVVAPRCDAAAWFRDFSGAGAGDDDAAPRLQALARVALDSHGGSWVVAGDVDGDGELELISAQCDLATHDHHHVVSLAAQKLDGRVLWRWGDSAGGKRALHHDVPCQLFDWDADGRLEVVVCDATHIIALDGADGRMKHSFPIPRHATDCVAFARLSGAERPDVLLKTRYTDLWAFTFDGAPLWHVHRPAGMRTSHHPYVVEDLGGPGAPGIVAGYQMLDRRGAVLWTLESKRQDLSKGHVDCCRVVRRADSLDDWRLAITTCQSLGLMMVDGRGRTVWEVVGRHFESIDVGAMRGADGVCVVADVDHRPWGQSPVCIFDETGNQLGEINTDYGRHHDLVDWTGRGNVLALAEARLLIDASGATLARLATDEADGPVRAVRCCGLPDRSSGLLLGTHEGAAAYLFQTGTADPPRFGTSENFTFY